MWPSRWPIKYRPVHEALCRVHEVGHSCRGPIRRRLGKLYSLFNDQCSVGYFGIWKKLLGYTHAVLSSLLVRVPFYDLWKILGFFLFLFYGCVVLRFVILRKHRNFHGANASIHIFLTYRIGIKLFCFGLFVYRFLLIVEVKWHVMCLINKRNRILSIRDDFNIHIFENLICRGKLNLLTIMEIFYPAVEVL